LDALEVRAQFREGETENDLFAFLTTEPNAVVAPIHPKAMPVILTPARKSSDG
jgi:putative SOS response-associated peptidase YedK